MHTDCGVAYAGSVRSAAPKIAVFIDWQNTYKTAREAFGWVEYPNERRESPTGSLLDRGEPRGRHELYGFERQAELGGGGGAAVLFEDWLEVQEPSLLEKIRAYNEDDCRSLYLLHRWLLELRPPELPWLLAPEAREQTKETKERSEELEALRAELLDGAAEGDPRWLLAQLLEYHRREEKPAWWEYFHHVSLDEEELIEGGDTIGGLELAGDSSRESTGTEEKEGHRGSCWRAVDVVRPDPVHEAPRSRTRLRQRRGRMTIQTMTQLQRLALLLGFHALGATAEGMTDQEQREVWMGLCPPPGWVAVDALTPDHAGDFEEAVKTVQMLQRHGYVTVRRHYNVVIYKLEPPGYEAGEMIVADPLLSAIASEPIVAEPGGSVITEQPAKCEARRGQREDEPAPET